MPQSSNFIAILALIVAVASLFFAFSQAGLSEQDRIDLRAIAQNLRDIQQKEIVMTSPLRTTVVVDESFPITDIFPKDFALEIDQDVPVDSQLTAYSNTGQVVTLNIADDLRIKSKIPIASQSLEGVNVRINKEIPIDTRFSATLKVNVVYGKELNEIINKLEQISEK